MKRVLACAAALSAAAAVAVGCVPNQNLWPSNAPLPNGTTCWNSAQDFLEVDCNTAGAAQYAAILYQPWPQISVYYVPGESA